MEKYEDFLKVMIRIQERFLEGKKIRLDQLRQIARDGEVLEGINIDLSGYGKMIKELPVCTIAGLSVVPVQIEASVIKGEEVIITLIKKFLPFTKLSESEIMIFNKKIDPDFLKIAIKGPRIKTKKIFPAKVYLLYKDNDKLSLMVYYIPRQRSHMRRSTGLINNEVYSIQKMPVTFSQGDIILVMNR